MSDLWMEADRYQIKGVPVSKTSLIYSATEIRSLEHFKFGQLISISTLLLPISFGYHTVVVIVNNLNFLWKISRVIYLG